MIRVIIIDDSLTIRKYIVEILEEQGNFEVLAEGSNGKEAIELVDKFRPDVILMDMMMPVMTGLAATEYIMAHFPTRILIVSSSTNRGELMKTYDALLAGAVSVIEKPSGLHDGEDWEKDFIEELKTVSKIPVIRHVKAKLKKKVEAPPVEESTETEKYDLIAMGASTGGPQTLLKIFQKLPKDFSIPILLVLHISDGFTTMLPEWLSLHSKLNVQFAKNGERVKSGKQVFLAPPNHHMTLEQNMIKLTNDPPQNFCRPSVDVLFESIAASKSYKSIGVILTGMGRDGAQGLKAIRNTGGYTIAQDEQSSLIYGMPKEAIKLGGVKRVLPLESIPLELIRLSR